MTDLPAVAAVVLDLGGVVVDWDPMHLYRKLFPDDDSARRFLSEICTLEWHAQHDLGRPMAETVPLLCAEHPEWVDEISAWNQRYPEMIAGYVDGMPELIDELRAAGVPLYALSNMPADVWPALLAAHPIMSSFEGVIVSGQELVAKPDAAIYDLLRVRFGLEPNTTVFVDDQPRNVDAAWTLGFRAVRFESAAQLRRSLVGWGVAVRDADPVE